MVRELNDPRGEVLTSSSATKDRVQRSGALCRRLGHATGCAALISLFVFLTGCAHDSHPDFEIVAPTFDASRVRFAPYLYPPVGEFREKRGTMLPFEDTDGDGKFDAKLRLAVDVTNARTSAGLSVRSYASLERQQTAQPRLGLGSSEMLTATMVDVRTLRCATISATARMSTTMCSPTLAP